MPRRTQVVFLHHQQQVLKNFNISVGCDTNIGGFYDQYEYCLVGNRVLKVERPKNACYVPVLGLFAPEKLCKVHGKLE